jgi:hypothetical protein
MDFVSPQAGGPSGLAFAADGSLLVAVSSTLAAFTGGVYLVPVNADGTGGTPASIWRSNPNDGVRGLAVTSGGRIVATLATSNKVVVLDARGQVLTTVSSPMLGSPVAAAARGRSVLVANQVAATVVRVVAD